MPTFYKKNSIFCRWNKSTCDFIPHLFVSIFLRFSAHSPFHLWQRLTSSQIYKHILALKEFVCSGRRLSSLNFSSTVYCLPTSNQPSRRWVLWKWKYSKEHRQYHRQEMDLELLKGHWNNWAGIIVVYLDKLCSECESYRSPMMMGFRSAKSEI